MPPAFDFSGAVVAAPGKGDRRPSPDVIDFVITPAAGEPDRTVSFGDRYFRRVAVPELGPYSAGTFWRQAKTVPLEYAVLTVQPLIQGFTKWNWGQDDFHFTNEGFFGTDTKYLGIDKLGHAYGTYIYSDILTQRIAQKTDNRAGAAVTGSIMGLAIQFGVEVGDGFSPDQGFSPQDMMFNTMGAGFSLLRNAVPGLADKLDFRYEYWKSEFSPFDPSADYSGQKYLLALKLSGFEAFEDSPLRFFELHAGYFARGVGDSTIGNGVARRREPYVGVGFNLQQLIKETPASEFGTGVAGRAAARIFSAALHFSDGRVELDFRRIEPRAETLHGLFDQRRITQVTHAQMSLAALAEGAAGGEADFRFIDDAQGRRHRIGHAFEPEEEIERALRHLEADARLFTEMAGDHIAIGAGLGDLHADEIVAGIKGGDTATLQERGRAAGIVLNDALDGRT